MWGADRDSAGGVRRAGRSRTGCGAEVRHRAVGRHCPLETDTGGCRKPMGSAIKPGSGQPFLALSWTSADLIALNLGSLCNS